MRGSVINPAPPTVEPVRTRRVHPTEVAVYPWQTGHKGNTKATQGHEPCGYNKEECPNGEPYGAREKDYWAEEDDAEDCGGDSEASEEEQDGAWDEEGWCMVFDFT